MNVHLTFDIEVWCGGWSQLDQRFPDSFERYVYGRSPAGDYAMPKTLETMRHYGLRGVFFVEPLFSARFGASYLRQITDLIQAAGQEVQLHLHPEWTDEIHPPLIADVRRKRQHLTYYTLQEQTTLIAAGKALLERAKGGSITAFRAGSFAANRDTFRALAANDIFLDSSLNEAHDHAQGSLPGWPRWATHEQIEGVHSFPVTVFSDGFGRPRPAQVGACSFMELRDALLQAEKTGCEHFVIVSHNFEMLKPGCSQPDYIVVRRFEKLCRFLSEHADRFPVAPYRAACESGQPPRPHASTAATIARHLQQLARRVI